MIVTARLRKIEIDVIFDDMITIVNNIIKGLGEFRKNLVSDINKDMKNSYVNKIVYIDKYVKNINNEVFLNLKDILKDSINNSNFFCIKNLSLKSILDKEEWYELRLYDLEIGDGVVCFSIEFRTSNNYFLKKIIFSDYDEFKKFLLYFAMSIFHELKHSLQFYSILFDKDIPDSRYKEAIDLMVRGYTLTNILYFLHHTEIDAYAYSFAYFLCKKFDTYKEIENYLKNLTYNEIKTLVDDYKLDFVYFYLILLKNGSVYKKFLTKTYKYIKVILNKMSKR